MSRFSHAFSLAATALVLALAPAKVAWSAPQEPPPAQSAASMKTYVETIPGTELKFEMVPIPGGSFLMGSPADRSQPREWMKSHNIPFRSPRSRWEARR